MKDPPMLLDRLFTHVRQQPEHTAVIDDRGQYTYQQLGAMIGGLGLYLSFQTTKPRVGILLPSGVGFVAGFYATLAAGKTVVPINFLLGDREIAHIIRDSGIDTILTAPPLSARLEAYKSHAEQSGAPLKVIDVAALPKPPAGMGVPELPTPTPDDLAVLMYTSGTSGLPKGVLLTHGN